MASEKQVRYRNEMTDWNFLKYFGLGIVVSAGFIALCYSDVFIMLGDAWPILPILQGGITFTIAYYYNKTLKRKVKIGSN